MKNNPSKGVHQFNGKQAKKQPAPKGNSTKSADVFRKLPKQ